jgi:hypothetical protein
MADLSVTPANVLPYAGAKIQEGRAGEALTAGQAVYLHTDGKVHKADCSTLAKAAAVGVTLNGAAAGQPVSYAQAGGVNPGATVAVGAVYGVTDTAGGIGPIGDRSTGDYITILGIGVTTSRINLAINASGVAIPA